MVFKLGLEELASVVEEGLFPIVYMDLWPLRGIYMKLSVDSLHQGDGFVLFCQTFSEDLSRGVSFS